MFFTSVLACYDSLTLDYISNEARASCKTVLPTLPQTKPKEISSLHSFSSRTLKHHWFSQTAQWAKFKLLEQLLLLSRPRTADATGNLCLTEPSITRLLQHLQTADPQVQGNVLEEIKYSALLMLTLCCRILTQHSSKDRSKRRYNIFKSIRPLLSIKQQRTGWASPLTVLSGTSSLHAAPKCYNHTPFATAER